MFSWTKIIALGKPTRNNCFFYINSDHLSSSFMRWPERVIRSNRINLPLSRSHWRKYEWEKGKISSTGGVVRADLIYWDCLVNLTLKAVLPSEYLNRVLFGSLSKVRKWARKNEQKIMIHKLWTIFYDSLGTRLSSKFLLVIVDITAFLAQGFDSISALFLLIFCLFSLYLSNSE